MSNEKFSTKQKIFIRTTAGASMHFIGSLIWSMVTDRDIDLKDKTKALDESKEIDQYHDFKKFWDWGDKQVEIHQHTSATANLEEAIKWARQSINFFECPHSHYIVFTHCVNPESLLKAFDNSKLIDISYTEEDLDQMAYNWVSKTGIYSPKALEVCLTSVQKSMNKLTYLKPESVANIKDLKLLTYISKFGNIRFKREMMNFSLDQCQPKFTIEFRNIANKKLLNQIDDLSNFLGLSLSAERKQSIEKMINDYADSQTKVPWHSHLTNYN